MSSQLGRQVTMVEVMLEMSDNMNVMEVMMNKEEVKEFMEVIKNIIARMWEIVMDQLMSPVTRGVMSQGVREMVNVSGMME